MKSKRTLSSNICPLLICLHLIIHFMGINKGFSEVKKSVFLSAQNKLSGVNKTYIDIGNGQKFELKLHTTLRFTEIFLSIR